MVRAPSARISQGHLPLTSWFPYLGLGSPQFLHYQSLPSMISGAIGTFVDPDTVFRWSIYLLLALWPLAVYWSGRLFGLSRWTAAAAAAVSPFLASAAGHRLRDQGLRLGGLRGVDPALGVVDAPAGVGLHLPGAVVAARARPAGRPLHHGDRRAALRDRVPGLRAAGGVALHRPLGPVAPARARRGARRGRRAGVGLGHRPAAAAVPLGGAQPGARGHRARERLRRRRRCCRGSSPAASTTPGAGPSSRSWSASASGSASGAGARSWPAAPS